MSKDELKKQLGKTRVAMEHAAKELDFIEAAKLRDEMKAIEVQIEKIA
ncbi:MAG: UvrB/UvrC motif-containing protein [Flavobacteriales bacterium]